MQTNWIGNKRVPGGGGEIAVLNPATEELIDPYPKVPKMMPMLLSYQRDVHLALGRRVLPWSGETQSDQRLKNSPV